MQQQQQQQQQRSVVDDRESHTITSHYCEENICLLASKFIELQSSERAYVVFITSESRQTCIWHQVLSEHPADLPVRWDYHVVLLSQPSSRIYDFDHTGNAAFPVDAKEYCRLSFEPPARFTGRIPPQLFRVVSAKAFVCSFSSDRSHMGDSEMPAPPYACLRGALASSAMNLFDYLSCDDVCSDTLEVALSDIEAAGALGLMMSKSCFLRLL